MRLLITALSIFLCLSKLTKAENQFVYGPELGFKDSSIITAIELHENQIITGSFLKKWFNENYLKSDQPVTVIRQKDRSNMAIYKIKLIGEAPTSLPRDYTFIWQIDRKRLFLLPFEYNYFFLMDNTKMIGGFSSYREYEYYQIFKFVEPGIILLFDSRNLKQNGIKVGYYKDDECIDYKPDRLHFTYDNKTNSITFSGNMWNFCESTKDRSSQQKTPLSIEKSSIRIYYSNGNWHYNSKSVYTSW